MRRSVALLARSTCIAACAGSVLITSAVAAGIRGIVSESMPRGLYRSEPFAGELRRGDTVEVCLPRGAASFARRRGYLAAGVLCPHGVQRIAKAVLAVPGDTVVVGPGGLEVRGAAIPNTRALESDSRGRALAPVPPGRYPVRPGTMWLVSTRVPNAYDSRYYGPVAQTALRRRFHPLWTEPREVAPTGLDRR